MYKIAIVGTDLMKWGGGIDFLIDFIAVLRRHPEKYQIFILLPRKSILGNVVRFFLKRSDYYYNLNRIQECLMNECPEIPIIKYSDLRILGDLRFIHVKTIAKKRKVDFLMPMSMVMERINDDSYSTISYIFDFQHKYYPELFDEVERKNRDIYFENLLSKYDYAFTQSKDTLSDIKKYYLDKSNKVFVMYDYPHKINSVHIDYSILDKYSIHHPYFIVCNQFWMHKAHKVVFEALEILYLRGITNLTVVCTGDTSDYRNKEHFSALMQYVSNLNCKDNITILGYIDKNDQIELMVGSIALIQPTLFEGNPGGGAVVDAEAYGVPCIVSDINVNLEIPSCYDVSYFRVNDATSLADKMYEAYLYPKEKKYIDDNEYEKFYCEYDKVFDEIKKCKTKL